MSKKPTRNGNEDDDRRPLRVPGGTLTLFDVLWLIVIWSIMSNPAVAHNVLQLMAKLAA